MAKNKKTTSKQKQTTSVNFVDDSQVAEMTAKKYLGQHGR